MRDCDTKCEKKALITTIEWIGVIAIIVAIIWACFT